MKKIFISTVILIAYLSCLSAWAQTGIYWSYEDFENEKMEEMDGYKTHSNSGQILFFMKDGERVKISSEQIWGFQYKGNLFRIDHKFNQPTYVAHVGDVVYYRNGIGFLRNLKSKSPSEFISIEYGFRGYISKDISSKIYIIGRKPIAQFATDYPEYAGLVQCIESKLNDKKNREGMNIFVPNCIAAWEK